MVSVSRKFCFLSALAGLTAACGAVDMPGSGVGKTTADGDTVQPSEETSFDLTKCGFDPTKSAGTISSLRMAMVPKSMQVASKVLGGFYSVQTNVTISGMAVFEDTLSRGISTFTAQSAPTVNSDQVDVLLGTYNSGFAADLMPPADRSQIGEKHPDWKGVFCTFQPAIKLERGSTEKVTASLSKPLPLAPLLVADIARMKSEIGVKRVWKGITATVTDSTDSNVPVGSSWTGGASSQPVSASAVIDGPNGKVTIKTELAVKMSYDFGSDATNKALGLPKSVTWFIDSATRSYKLMQVDFGDGVPVNFLPAK